MSNDILQEFDNIIKHVEINCLEKCTHDVMRSEVVALLMLWYVNSNDEPIWMNISINSADSKEYFEMELLDSNIDQIKIEKSSNVHDVIEWINYELSSTKEKCDFDVFIQ